MTKIEKAYQKSSKGYLLFCEEHRDIFSIADWKEELQDLQNKSKCNTKDNCIFIEHLILKKTFEIWGD